MCVCVCVRECARTYTFSFFTNVNKMDKTTESTASTAMTTTASAAESSAQLFNMLPRFKAEGVHDFYHQQSYFTAVRNKCMFPTHFEVIGYLTYCKVEYNPSIVTSLAVFEDIAKKTPEAKKAYYEYVNRAHNEILEVLEYLRCKTPIDVQHEYEKLVETVFANTQSSNLPFNLETVRQTAQAMKRGIEVIRQQCVSDIRYLRISQLEGLVKCYIGDRCTTVSPRCLVCLLILCTDSALPLVQDIRRMMISNDEYNANKNILPREMSTIFGPVEKRYIDVFREFTVT